MKISTAYQYTTNNQIIVTTNVNDVPVDVTAIQLVHLCADANKLLTNGKSTLCCVNTFDPAEWYEIDAPIYEDVD